MNKNNLLDQHTTEVVAFDEEKAEQNLVDNDFSENESSKDDGKETDQ